MSDAKSVIETLNYVRKFSGQSIAIKLGGAPLEDLSLVSQLCEDLALLRAAGVSFIIVHGGGKSISEELKLRGLQAEFVNGQRVTSPEMMDVVEMVLCGKINKSLVRTLVASGVNAVGISGVDGNMLQCERLNASMGEVGKIKKLDLSLLQDFMTTQKVTCQGRIPVVAPLGIDSEGRPLNVNADWAASKLTQNLGIRKLIFLTDEDGILDQDGKVISELSISDLLELIASEQIVGGMRTKAETIIEALENGVKEVHVINGSRPHSLIEELYTDQGVGTLCRKTKEQK